jgi:hypothetical protein
VEAIQCQPAGSPPRELKDSIIDRRGSEARNIAKVAAARKLLTCVFKPTAADRVLRRRQAVDLTAIVVCCVILAAWIGVLGGCADAILPAKAPAQSPQCTKAIGELV